jgi:hypothetical protein
VILALTGCAVSIKPPPPLPDEYTALCGSIGVLADGKHATVEVWAIETATGYRVCAETHAKLVDAIKRRDAIYK